MMTLFSNCIFPFTFCIRFQGKTSVRKHYRTRISSLCFFRMLFERNFVIKSFSCSTLSSAEIEFQGAIQHSSQLPVEDSFRSDLKKEEDISYTILILFLSYRLSMRDFHTLSENIDIEL